MDNDMEKSNIKKKKGLSPIWILPAVALSIGIWLLYKSVVEKPIDIVVHFHSAEGVTAGKTKVMFKGLPIGVVKKITVDEGLDTVSMKIAISRQAEKGLVQDVKFWIVRPEVSAGRVRGLETLLTGSYIAVQPGKSKIPCREFVGLDEPPPVPEDAPGLHIRLETDALNSLQKGSAIYYKDIKVGSIQGYKMEESGRILIDGYIEPEYASLVKPGTRFWNASGITLKGGLNGIIFHMQSLSSLISGGVSFYTPQELMNQPPAKNGEVFKLYRDYEDAQYGIEITLKLFDGENIVEGLTKVIYQGIEVGRVKKLSLNQNDRKYKVTATILMDPMAESALREGTKFWIIRPRVGLGGVSNLSTLVSGPYITFVPGSGKEKRRFTVQGSHSKEILKEGTYYRLRASDLHALDPGAPVLFKHIQVGEVAKYTLNKDNSVDLVFIIYDEFEHLINDRCVFWNYSGLNLKVTPAAVSVSTDSLKAILSGGIAFDYPQRYYKRKLKKAKPWRRFRLYDSYADAVKHVPDLKPGGIFVRLETDEPVSVISGSPIYYKKVQVGEITGVKLDSKKDKIVINAFIKKNYLDLITTSSRFYLTSGLEMKGSIRSGFKVRTSPLASIVMGAVSFVNSGKGKKIREWHSFRLFPDLESAKNADYVPITIRFASSRDLEANSKLRYQGVNIGFVKNVQFEKDMKSVRVTALVNRRYASLFTPNTKVWVVRPEFGLSGVRNLETVITGPYIAILPGQGTPVRHLVGLDSPPAVPYLDKGLHIVVEADSLGSLKRGCPVYYKQVKVGRVLGYELSPDSSKVWIHLNIFHPYSPLVRQGSRFWNVSGVRINAGIFSGVKVKTESVEAIMAGGIAFATPEGEDMGPTVAGGTHFTLYKKAEDDWLEWSPKIPLGKANHVRFKRNVSPVIGTCTETNPAVHDDGLE